MDPMTFTENVPQRKIFPISFGIAAANIYLKLLPTAPPNATNNILFNFSNLVGK